MNKAPESMNKRQVVLEDGRYLIYYTFAPSVPVGYSHPVPIQPAKAENPAEEN